LPELSETEIATARERIRSAWQREYPAVPLPEALSFAERGIEAITLAEGSYTGLLVALWLDPEQASQLAIAGGEAADQLHVTLCYVPDMADTDDVTWARVIAAQADVAASYLGLTGRVSGFGRFGASDKSDGRDVFWALPEIDGLEWFRESVMRAMHQAGVYDAFDERYWIPHITLSYLAPKAKTPPAPPMIDLSFSGITVVAGNRRVNIPFYNQQGTEYVGVYESMYYAERSTRKPQTGKARESRRLSHRAFLEPAEWIQWLPGPGTYYHEYWGELTYTPEKLARMVKNFHDGVYGQELPVDIDHELKLSGAVGYITDMRIGTAGAIEVKVDWTDRGTTLLAEDRFKYVSADYFEEWQSPVTGEWIRDVPAGMAICTHPYFKTDVLRPLAASEIAASVQFGEQSPKETIGMGEKQAEQEVKTPPAEAGMQFSEAEVKAFREFQAMGGAAKLTEITEQNQKLSADVTTLQADARKKRFTDIVLGRAEGSDGARWRGDVERHVAHMTQLAEAFGDESQVLKDYIDDRKADAIAFAEGIDKLTKPIGTSRGGDHVGSAWEQIDAKAKEFAETKGVTIEQARVEIMKTHPELKRQYDSERHSVRTEEE